MCPLPTEPREGEKRGQASEAQFILPGLRTHGFSSIERNVQGVGRETRVLLKGCLLHGIMRMDNHVHITIEA